MNDNIAVSLGVYDYIIMAVYFVVVITIGLWFTRNEKDSQDYLLGGRRIPWLAVGISYMMSLLSTVSLVAVPGEIFNHGLSFLVLGLAYPITSILAFYIFMRFYFKLKSFTPFEYLQCRFDSRMRLLVSVIYTWTRLLYLAMVLFTCSVVFEGCAGWPVWFTILLMGVISIIYTVFGGMKAVVWADIAQFVVLVGGIGAAVFICIKMCDGGFTGIISYAFEHGRGPSRFAEADFYQMSPYIRLCFWLLLLNVFLEPIMYNSCDQISIQRLLSASSYENAKKAIYTNSFFSLPFTLMLWFIGLAIFSYYSQHPDPRVTSGDTAFFTFIATKMPAPLPGLMLAAMLAAAMSTLTAGMNSLSAVGLKEIYMIYIKPSASETKQVLLSRWMTVGTGGFMMLVALFISLTSQTLRESVIESLAIWGALSGILVPIYILAVTSSRVTTRSIWVCIAACWGISMAMTTWYMISKRGVTGPIGELWVLVPLFITLALLVVAKMNAGNRKYWQFGSILTTGYAMGTCFWYLSSHFLGGGELSFLWVGFPGVVLFLSIGYTWTIFSKQVSNDKHMGLTLWSMRATIAENAVEPVREGDAK